ncbi:MAG: NAD(+) diphosphatase [Solirubrobacteraceae bacterium]|jgi:NAD+ diphosphatase
MSSSDHTPGGRPFTGMALDRAVLQRSDPEWLQRSLSDPSTRSVAADSDGVLISDDDSPSLIRMPFALDGGQEPILLGLEQEVALFALDLDELAPDARAGLTDGGRIASLRDAGAQLTRAEGGLAGYLSALLSWHRRHRFCANCGARTEVAEAGQSRHCPRCGTAHFPRTDPVVIMTVAHERRLLLGHRTGWPAGRYSVLAGFVAPGESAEEAVVREVREESGIEVRDPVFVSSQPWPFPSQLMLGFDAQADGGEPQASDGELDDVRWFTSAQIVDALHGRSSELLPPPPISIARFLIERWLAARG